MGMVTNRRRRLMLIFGSVARLLKEYSRHSTMLLVRVADKTIRQCSRDGDDDGDGDGDDERAYAQLRPFIIVHESDVLPAYDPRLELLLDIEVLSAYSPMQLEGIERQQQASAKRLASDAAGLAMVYRATACVDARMMPSALAAGITVSRLKSVLPLGLQPVLARSMRGSMTMQLASLRAIDEVFAGMATTTQQRERWAFVTMFADSFASSAEYSALVSHGLATPSSLQRLAASELLAVFNYMASVLEVAAGDDATQHVPLAIGRLLDVLPLSLVGTRRRLRLHATYERAWNNVRGTATLDKAVNVARTSQSTVCSLDAELSPECLQLLELVPALVPLNGGSDSKRMAFARDAELEHEVARLIDEREHIVIVAAAGSVLNDIERRLQDLHVAPLLEADIVYIAPTASHAAACPFDALSVDDVLAGQYRRTRQPRSIVLVFAHALGVDSFVHCLRAFPSASTVALVGDPYNGDGSPRESDRGAVLRDLAAAARRRYVKHVRLESLYGLSATGPLGPLTADEHAALRRYKQPTLAEHAYSIVASIDDVPLHARNLMLVGASSPTYACAVAGVDKKTSYTVSSFIAFDELGQVARVTRKLRLRAVPDPLRRRIVEADCEEVDSLALDALGACVLLEEPSLIDHRYCCHTNVPNLAVLAMHAARRVFVAVPARGLARVTPVPIDDDVACIITDRSGIEDIRAAMSLARRHVYFIATERSFVASALERHGPRPVTQLVDILSRSERRSYECSTLAHHWPDAAVGEPPYRFLYLGSTDSTSVVTSAAGVENGVENRTLALVHSLHEHLDAFLLDQRQQGRPAVGIAETAVPSVLEEASAPVTRPTIVPAVFAVSDVDVATLARLHVSIVDLLLQRRLWALVRAHRLGTLGEDADSAHIDECYSTYPYLSASERLGSNERVALRAREAAVIHLFCMITKGLTKAEDWYVAAESALLRHRAERAGTDSMAAASLGSRHAAAVRSYMASAVVQPTPNPEDMKHVDAYDFFGKLQDVRSYLDECL